MVNMNVMPGLQLLDANV